MITNVSKGRLIGLSFIICHLSFSAALTACSEWNDHYEESQLATSHIEVYDGDVASFMKSDSNFGLISALFQETGVYESMKPDGKYTFIVCDNAVFSKSEITDKPRFANYCVADLAISPAQLSEGFGIRTRANKNIWVYGTGSSLRLDDFNVVKTVKAANGYIYVIDGVLPIRYSVYEYLQSLGDDYSLFKQFVADEEATMFDAEHSTPIGISDEGQTVYDSLMITVNSLADRYTEDGIQQWNMRDEAYLTTMFIPNNALIEKAMKSALDSIPSWLYREPTAADTLKFRQWIVRACFADRRIAASELSADAPIFASTTGYQRVEDKQADRITYKSVDPAYWLPARQTVDTGHAVSLSNGLAYYCTDLKIPNHVVIYRVKNRLYQVWNAIPEEQLNTYFRWTNWTMPRILENAQGEFKLTDDPRWPTIYYHVLTAEPTADAVRDSLMCSVEYDGLMYNETDNTVRECRLPAGEYYLRMGFKHSLTYSLSMYFNDRLLVKDMVMNAQASNFHLDRSGASDIPRYGALYAGYPEGYDPAEWLGVNESASAYDTDGYTVGLVTLEKNGNFTIRIESADNAYRYPYALGDVTQRTGKNVAQLMMYHWCLRPTINNY